MNYIELEIIFVTFDFLYLILMSNLSKWKNVFGEQVKTGSFDSLNPRCTISSDGSLIDVSPNFVAVNWLTSGGGAVGIFNTTKFERVKGDFPLIRGHTAIVTDIKFSPFNAGLLATSSDDGTVKLWSIPQEGLTEDIREETQKFTGHLKKAGLINFNPVVNEVIATAGNDNDIFVWNITNAEEIFKIKTEDHAFNIEWSSNGSLLGAMHKDKKLRLYDIRASTQASLTTDGHGTSKIQRMSFADGSYIFSSGFNAGGYREVRLYDTRSFEKPLHSHKIDTLQGMLSNYYDEDTGMAYFYGKGESVVNYLEIKDGSLKTGSTYSEGDQAIGLSFFPKRTMDYNSSELARCAKLTKDSVVYVSFKYPRRNAGFVEEFYPDCLLGEPCTTYDEWIKGANNTPIRKKITDIENKFKTEPLVFEKKAPEEKKTINVDSVLQENDQLRKKIVELEAEIERLKANI